MVKLYTCSSRDPGALDREGLAVHSARGCRGLDNSRDGTKVIEQTPLTIPARSHHIARCRA